MFANYCSMFPVGAVVVRARPHANAAGEGHVFRVRSGAALERECDKM